MVLYKRLLGVPACLTLYFTLMLLGGCAASNQLVTDIPSLPTVHTGNSDSSQSSADMNANMALHMNTETAALTLEHPVDGKLTSAFGMRRMNKNKSRFHYGIDISAPKGTRVTAAASGVVIFSGRKKDYGLTVEIAHDDSITRYAHLDSLKAKKGQRVTAGSAIGTMGRSGRTTGINLHFELIVDGQRINPLKALKS